MCTGLKKRQSPQRRSLNPELRLLRDFKKRILLKVYPVMTNKKETPDCIVVSVQVESHLSQTQKRENFLHGIKINPQFYCLDQTSNLRHKTLIYQNNNLKSHTH